MKKYIGRYRVVCEFDRNTLKPIKNDTYILCHKDGQIYRINDYLLAYYRPNKGKVQNFIDKLKNSGISFIENHSSDEDILIYFKEKEIDNLAKEVGAFTSGANILPTSILNLRKQKWFKNNMQEYIDKGLYKPKKELSEEEKIVFRERFIRMKNNKIKK